MECQHCGMCCEDSRIRINLTAGDVWRICSFLKISIDEFFEKYAGLKKFLDPRHPETFDVDLGLNIPCKFRKDERCSIYKARPVNCRIFPYWVLVTAPENKLKEILKYRCKYDLNKKKIYKRYQDAIAKILLEESKWLEIDKKIGREEEIKMEIPVEEVKKAVARNLNKISLNAKELEDAEKILKD